MNIIVIESDSITKCDCDGLKHLNHHKKFICFQVNTVPQLNMLIYSDTLSWFGVNQFLLFLLHNVCLEEKQQIPLL
jgi:hypothetical protein